GRSAQAMAVGPQGDIWVGTPTGLLVVDSRTGQLLRSVTEMRGVNVTAIAFDSTQSLWVGTRSGLFKLNPYNGAIVGQVPSLPSEHILSISPDTGNKIWVGTTEGLGWVSRTTGRGTPHGSIVSAVGAR
ncbi:MAG: two-component regulator propeller domain-containing protein, partial [Cyanobacteria bacterium J06576_12]